MRVVILGLVLMAFGAGAQPILSGFPGPLTGPWEVEGDWALKSVQIAVEMVNGRGGILGPPSSRWWRTTATPPKGGPWPLRN